MRLDEPGAEHLTRPGNHDAPRRRTRTTTSERSAPPRAPFDHGPVSRFNAWFFSTFDPYLNLVSRSHKRAAFAGIDAPAVVEIGAGTGANLAYLPAGTSLHAIEPSLHMHPRLRRRAQRAGVELHLHTGGAERIELPDASVDEVICSLVLCTVDDPLAVLSEVRRVLRPGGRFRFVEHVASEGAGRGWLQRRIRRPWGWLFEGCDPHRHTAAVIDAAGFDEVRIEREKFHGSVFVPVNTAIWGIATR